MVGTAGKIREENRIKRKINFTNVFCPIRGEWKADMDFWIQHWMKLACALE